MARATSERFPSERQLDWIGCDDFVPCPIDVVSSDRYRAHIHTQRVVCRNLSFRSCIVNI